MRAEDQVGRYQDLPLALNVSTLSLSPEGKALMASRDINVVALVKGSERYVFLYDDDSRTETLRTLNRYASDPKLSFSWYDASRSWSESTSKQVSFTKRRHRSTS